MEDTQTHDTSVIREKQADEVCDIYDIYGNRTGKTFVRGEPLSDGQYVMVVDVWIVNSKDEILIQKRSDLKRTSPAPGQPTAAVCWQEKARSRRASVNRSRKLESTSCPPKCTSSTARCEASCCRKTLWSNRILTRQTPFCRLRRSARSNG